MFSNPFTPSWRDGPVTNQNLDGTSASISTPELSIGQPQPDLEFNDFSQQHFQSPNSTDFEEHVPSAMSCDNFTQQLFPPSASSTGFGEPFEFSMAPTSFGQVSLCTTTTNTSDQGASLILPTFQRVSPDEMADTSPFQGISATINGILISGALRAAGSSKIRLWGQLPQQLQSGGNRTGSLETTLLPPLIMMDTIDVEEEKGGGSDLLSRSTAHHQQVNKVDEDKRAEKLDWECKQPTRHEVPLRSLLHAGSSEGCQLTLQITDHLDDLASVESINWQDVPLIGPPSEKKLTTPKQPTTRTESPNKCKLISAAFKANSIFEDLDLDIANCEKSNLASSKRHLLRKKDTENLHKDFSFESSTLNTNKISPRQSMDSVKQTIYPSLLAGSEEGSSSQSTSEGSGNAKRFKKRSLKKCNEIITLRRPLYYSIPCVAELEKMKKDHGNCLVKGFTVGRLGYGNVYFPETMDVANLNIDKILHISYKEINVYPGNVKKPPVGEGLNRRAFITLDAVHPIVNGKSVKQPNKALLLQFVGQLEEVCAKKNMTFLEYRAQTGSFVFEVEHFATYNAISLANLNGRIENKKDRDSEDGKYTNVK